jgi:hypothetical protein
MHTRYTQRLGELDMTWCKPSQRAPKAVESAVDDDLAAWVEQQSTTDASLRVRTPTPRVIAM